MDTVYLCVFVAGKLLRLPKIGGDAVAIAEVVAGIATVLVDADHVFVRLATGDPLWMRKDGGDAVTLTWMLLPGMHEVIADRHVLPFSMLAGSSDQLLYRWSFPDVDEQLRLAFARGTCNGCHTGEHPVIDTAFHVSPHRKGREKLSQFMYDSKGSGNDEVTKRTKLLTATLCETK